MHFTKEEETSLRIGLKTLEEMLEDRNYIQLRYSYPELDIIKRVNHGIYLTPEGKRVVVEIVRTLSTLQNYIKYINDPDIDFVLLVYLNNKTLLHLTKEKNFNNKLEIWPIFNLYINISRFHLQPKIEKYTGNNNAFGKIPKILHDDPIVRYYRFKSKDILKITDKNGYINYRIVV